MDALTRCFIGIRAPNEVQEKLAAIQLDIKRRGGSDAVKWSSKDELHLTLCFLGELRVEQLSNVQRELDGFSLRYPAMELQVDGLSGFPNGTQPKVIAANVTGSDSALVTLQSELEKALEPFVTHRENKAFTPHITLGRVRTDSDQARTGMGRALRLVQTGIIGPWLATQFELMRSAVGPTGPTYATIQGYSLRTQEA